MIPGSPATATLRRLLTELGEAGRTGALHIDGHPGGVFYLVAGRIAYASSPACRGLEERLIDSGRITAAEWATVLAAGRGAHRVGRALLGCGLIGENELALRVVATIADATLELLQSDDAPVRFVPGERHWLGAIAPVELGALGHATAQRLRSVPRPARSRRGVSRSHAERVRTPG